MTFPQAPSNLAQQERELVTQWNTAKIFERTIKAREGAPPFIFFDGPPFATGLPHYGHLLAGTIKDTVCRFMTMRGFQVPRRFGWDCHGLPIESLIEKTEGLHHAQAIRDYGIERFNEKCRWSVLTYADQWRTTTERLGRWIDMENPYRTMDVEYMESVWWVFKELFKQGLVYEGYKVMPFSWKLGTPLSNFEAGENYQWVDDPSIIIAFVDAEDPDLAYLAWTTTPWTLPSNMALMVGPTTVYCSVAINSKRYILAKDRLPIVFPDQPYELVEEYTGEELVGRRYHPLFDDFSSYTSHGAFRIAASDSVSTAEGTGIVHAAPAFGEEDFNLCQREQIPLVCPINPNGCFTALVPWLEGMLWKDAQETILSRLKARGLLLQRITLRHRYPFCYRTDTPLIYRVSHTWFIAVEKIKEQLIEENASIHWVPEHIRDGRFGKWLEGAKDWAVSRNRFWGTPMPIWREPGGGVLVVGSREELQRLTGVWAEDLHRHCIDPLVIEHEGKRYQRIDEVFDCWFESGAMPYGQSHYPFTASSNVSEHLSNQRFLTCDFIAEGLDQTRGWFYTLHVLSCALFKRKAFKNVIVNGIVLAEDGSKMSKRLKNYPDPLELIERHGADALRLYFLGSPVVRGQDLAFSEAGVESTVKHLLLPLWNAYTFFRTYANLAVEPSAIGHSSPSTLELDEWIIARVLHLQLRIEESMEAYHLWEAVEAFTQFIDELTNWYIRRSRRRFWSDCPKEQQLALNTLYRVLLTISSLLAPFAPFTAEALYARLRALKSQEQDSVHLLHWPKKEMELRRPFLEQQMEALQRLSSMGHSLRKQRHLRVRQPLREAVVVDLHHAFAGQAHHLALLAQELNVKQVRVERHLGSWLGVRYRPNFKQLGPRVGALLPRLQKAIASMQDADYEELLQQGRWQVDLGEVRCEILPTDVERDYWVAPGCVALYEQGLAILLDTSLDPQLQVEGLARDLISRINTWRKELGLAITDRVTLNLSLLPHQGGLSQEALQGLPILHGAEIAGEVLAREVLWELPRPAASDTAPSARWEFDGAIVEIQLLQVHQP